MVADYAEAKRKALNVLEESGITEPTVDVFEIARQKGVDIKIYRSNENLKDVSGFFDPETKVIFINGDDSPRRQNFTIAHELGHFVMEHEPNEYGVLPRIAAPTSDPKEKEANCFAANLLVPEYMLKNVMKKYKLEESDVSALSKIFGVSESMMKIRLDKI